MGGDKARGSRQTAGETLKIRLIGKYQSTFLAFGRAEVLAHFGNPPARGYGQGLFCVLKGDDRVKRIKQNPIKALLAGLALIVLASAVQAQQLEVIEDNCGKRVL